MNSKMVAKVFTFLSRLKIGENIVFLVVILVVDVIASSDLAVPMRPNYTMKQSLAKNLLRCAVVTILGSIKCDSIEIVSVIL